MKSKTRTSPRAPRVKSAPRAPQAKKTEDRSSRAFLDGAIRLSAFWDLLFAPRCTGLEHIPKRGPAMVVANHNIFGLVDTPLIVLEVYRKRGVMLRGMADRVHFALPLWRDLLARGGAVLGTRENCRRLLEAGEVVLTYPGGGREVMKRKGEKYKLLWGDHLGFARMAVRFGCPIIPAAVVGGEEMYDILLDANHPLMAPLRAAMNRAMHRDDLPPIVHGVGPTLFPHPERLYFSFGKPISTARWKGRQEDAAVCLRVRDRAKVAVEKQIAALLRRRERDPDRRMTARLRHALRPG